VPAVAPINLPSIVDTVTASEVTPTSVMEVEINQIILSPTEKFSQFPPNTV